MRSGISTFYDGQSLLSIGVKLTRSIENGWYKELSLDREVSLTYVVEVQEAAAAIVTLASPIRFTPLASLSPDAPDEATPQQRLVSLLHFKSPATATSNHPSTRFAFRSYALLTLLHGASVDAMDLEADWDIKQAANLATACHERAVAQRIHEFFVRMQKATDAKRKGEAKAWAQLKMFWVAVVRGLGVLGEDGRHGSGSVVA